ncbi:MAG: hypothetical protein KC731_43105 [Myxococcales bacterium]|nr:hypothetical protein [Myxococcales bacterium]
MSPAILIVAASLSLIALSSQPHSQPPPRATVAPPGTPWKEADRRAIAKILAQLKTEATKLDERLRALTTGKAGPDRQRRLEAYRQASEVVWSRSHELRVAVENAGATKKMVGTLARLHRNATKTQVHAKGLGNEANATALSEAARHVTVLLRDKSDVAALLEPIVSR